MAKVEFYEGEGPKARLVHQDDFRTELCPGLISHGFTLSEVHGGDEHHVRYEVYALEGSHVHRRGEQRQEKIVARVKKVWSRKL